MDRFYSDNYVRSLGKEKDKKRNFPDLQDIEQEEEEDDDHSSQPHPKRNCPQYPTSGFEGEAVSTGELFSHESLSFFEEFFRRVIGDEAERKIKSLFCSPPPLLSNVQLNGQLYFLNQTSSSIFTNSNIESVNGEALKVALCDAGNSNAVIRSGPFSSVRIQIVVLNGDFGRSYEEDGVFWTVSDFNKSVLHEREGKRPIIIGHDHSLTLENGVGSIKNLSFTDNSCWTRSGKFRLGARIKDPKVSFDQFSRVFEAISQPFKVMDHRGDVNKKHHPPTMEDEVWRLEGIGKGGVYHRRLSGHNITNVYDFLNAYMNNPSSLKELLGNKVPKSTWKAMVDNALECLHDTTLDDASYEINLGVDYDALKGEGYKGNFEVLRESMLADMDDGFGFSKTTFSDQLMMPSSAPTLSAQFQDLPSMLQDPPLFPIEDAWMELVTKPK